MQNWSDITSSASTSLSHTFTGLTDGTNYEYRVRAVNATGHSADSDDSDAVQPGAATLTRELGGGRHGDADAGPTMASTGG